VNHHNLLTAGGWLTDPLPCPRERDKVKKESPSNQAQQKLNSKGGKLVDNTSYLCNLKTTCKLKLPHFTERGADQTDADERQKKNLSTQPHGIMAELLLEYQHQDWMLKE
jgi:hypothetical protein